MDCAPSPEGQQVGARDKRHVLTESRVNAAPIASDNHAQVNEWKRPGKKLECRAMFAWTKSLVPAPQNGEREKRSFLPPNKWTQKAIA